MPPKTSKKQDNNKEKTQGKLAGKNKVRVVQGLDSFRYWNGDSYIGNYVASSQQTVSRTGEGRYITADGSMYSGQWEKDRFLNGTIKYNDSTIFEGQLDNHKYAFEGVYKIPNVGEMRSDFKYNVPRGDVILTDINKRIWYGKLQNPGEVRFLQKNHFKTTSKPSSTSNQNSAKSSLGKESLTVHSLREKY